MNVDFMPLLLVLNGLGVGIIFMLKDIADDIREHKTP